MTIDAKLAEQIERLKKHGLKELRQRYREAYGEDSSSTHREHLIRRIAWRWQAMQCGDISERARRRAIEIARDADLKTQVPTQWTKAAMAPPGRRIDPRLPEIGTVLEREYHGRRIAVERVTNGFVYDGREYGSLSAVAQAVTGSHWNGLVFFGLAKRPNRRVHAE